MTTPHICKSVVADLLPLGLVHVGGRGCADSVARPCITISSPMPHIVYMLPFSGKFPSAAYCTVIIGSIVVIVRNKVRRPIGLCHLRCAAIAITTPAGLIKSYPRGCKLDWRRCRVEFGDFRSIEFFEPLNRGGRRPDAGRHI